LTNAYFAKKAVSMSSSHTSPGRSQAPAQRANERFKAGWNACLAGSLITAGFLHAVLLYTWPESTIEVEAFRSGSPTTMLSLGAAPEIRVPSAPSDVHVSAPKIPSMADVQIELRSEVAVSLPTFDDPALTDIAALVPTAHANPEHWLDYENFAPFVSYPRVRNEGEVQHFLQRHYEPLLNLTGASGVVQVAFWIDEGGEVWKAEIAESSGYRSLDRLAMRLSNLLRFSPATRLGQPVRVQVRVPIIFRET
jgi:TonB family protein